jgi:hypothetical protein
MYSAKAAIAAEDVTDGKKSQTIMPTTMAAIINSTAVLMTTPELFMNRGRPYRSFVSGSLVSVGISPKNIYKRNIASSLGGSIVVEKGKGAKVLPK